MKMIFDSLKSVVADSLAREAGKVLKSLRFFRTLSAPHSTSKANLPLPGDSHGLIPYLVSVLMRSGL